MGGAKDWEAQTREHKRQWARWNEICPPGFEDAVIKEHITGKQPERPAYDIRSGNSPLDD
jgi:hypothetical protein